MDRVDNSCVLNSGHSEDQCQCYGYKRSWLRCLVGHFLSIILLGLPYLVARWKPSWGIHWFNTPCSLKSADKILVKDLNGDLSIEKILSKEVNNNFFRKYSSTNLRNEELNDTTRLLVDVKRIHRYFHHKHIKYIWNSENFQFVRLNHLDHDKYVSNLLDNYNGYSVEEQNNLLTLYGFNSIEVEVKSYAGLLVDEILNPFYIFQVGSMILWSLDEYYYYAGCILIVSFVSIIVSLIETRQQSQMLHDMVSSSNNLEVNVSRGNNRFEKIPSQSLVPGDIISIPSHGCIMPCDAVLLSGSCIVNESMLTGESVPVTKSSLPPTDKTNDEIYNPDLHKRNTLFAGTSVIQTRFFGHDHVLAIVARTGFLTSKGELVRSILYPKPLGFKFYKDSIRFVFFLFGIATLGMIYNFYIYASRGAAFYIIILRCLDIFTVVVPPALPAAMTVGTYYAQNRLKKKNIFCISPQRINMCGKLKLVCFDKTGTLTEDGLDMWGVMESQDGQFMPLSKDILKFDIYSKLLNCMASCHSLTYIDNELAGDPLDIKMFESTDWLLEEQGKDYNSKFDMLMPIVVKPKIQMSVIDDLEINHLNHEVGIVRQFTFSSTVARMSVITRTLKGSNFEVFTKGAPEKLEELCKPETIPSDFHYKLKKYTVQGLRVIGMAHRHLPSSIDWIQTQKIKRHEVEKDMTFLGFIIMQNTLKPETTPVIKELLKANIRCVMVTGDNILTAISVARDCKMIPSWDQVITVDAEEPKNGFLNIKYIRAPGPDSFNGEILAEQQLIGSLSSTTMGMEEGLNQIQDYHFAISGKSWAVIRNHYPQLIPKFILKGTIFARMGPEQKAQLVEELQNVDYIVSMCGDGANDCGALKTANVGISLSEAEASVAAPFTSKVANITCVPTIIKEGRCALVTSFGVFKYMALYSMIQFISVEILYTLKTNFADAQFLYLDLVITMTVAVLMGMTSAYPKLVAKRPPGSLVSGIVLLSIIAQICCCFLFQYGAYVYLTTKSWYHPIHLPNPDAEIFICWETTTIFIISSFQYLILAFTYSKGAPYRASVYTNIPFFVAIILLSLFSVILILRPGSTLSGFFELISDGQHFNDPEWSYRVSVIFIAFINIIVCLIIEYIITECVFFKKFLHQISKKKEPKNKFKKLLNEIKTEDCPITHYHSPEGSIVESLG